MARRKQKPAPAPLRERILAALGRASSSVTPLAKKLRHPPDEVYEELQALLARGEVSRRPDGRWSLLAAAERIKRLTLMIPRLGPKREDCQGYVDCMTPWAKEGVVHISCPDNCSGYAAIPRHAARELAHGQYVSGIARETSS